MHFKQTELIFNERIHAIDFIRLFIYLAIASFHFQDIVWFNQGYIFSSNSLAWHLTEQYARTFSYGGQIVVLITFFLIGFRENTKQKLKSVLYGSLVASILMDFANYTKNGSLLIWDIYPLIFTGTLILLLSIYFSKNFSLVLGVLGILMLNIKFWEKLNNVELAFKLKIALVGDCNSLFADWPILPWIGLIWFSFALGQWCYSNLNSCSLNTISKIEIFLWLIFLSFSVVFFNSYRNVPTNDNWACFVFRQEPYLFISQLILYIFLIRISLLKKINDIFSQFKISILVSRLQLSKNFGLFYLTHYLIIVLIYSLYKNLFSNNAIISFLIFIISFPLSEIILNKLITLLKNKA